MQPPGPHPQEPERLAALRALGVLDAPPSPTLDRIVRLAARLLGAPIALVSLVDTDRVWFQTRVGLDACEAGRDASFCGHTILGEEPLVVADARADPRFADTPQVAGPEAVRFYAGVALRDQAGLPLGTLCVMDRIPRELTEEGRQLLEDLAAWTVRELVLRDLEALRASEVLHKATLESVGTSVIVTDTQGLILAFNRAAETMLGYQAGEMIGRQTPAIIHLPEEVVARAETLSQELGTPIAPGFEVFVAKARAGGQETREWTYLRKDGSRVPVTLSVSAIRNPAGEITAFVGVATDMTEPLLQAEALRLSERRFQEMAERVPGIIYQFQTWPDGRQGFPFISPRVRDLYGVDAEVWLHNPAWPLEQILPEDQPSYVAAFQEALEQLGTFDWEGRTRTGRPGEILWIHARSSPHPQPDGNVLWEGILTDLTPIRAREDALRESEARSRALLEALPDRVYRLRRDGIVLDARVPAQVQVFVPPAQLIGHSVYEFLPEEAARRIHAGIERALQTGQMAMAEYQALVQGNLRELEGRCVPLNEQEVVAVVRDITERKAMERMRDDFVSTVNHELRTPLTAIRGALGLIRSGLGGALSGQGHHLLELAHANVERLARLINDILDTEKIQAGQARVTIGPEEALPLLVQAVDSMATLAESRGVGFQLAPLDGGLRILVDRDRFIQVLVNLLSNAAKFNPADAPVQVRTLPRPGWLRIEVKDQGPGIPEDFRERIFQKFAQADASTTRTVGGTGLGLAIVKSLTEQMGGLVGFESEPGRTVFFVEFPTVEA